MPVGIWAGQMSTYQRVMKYICTHTCMHTCIHAHMAGTCVAIYCRAHKQHRKASFGSSLLSCSGMIYELCWCSGTRRMCVCVLGCEWEYGVCVCVCVWLCLIYYILAFWQIAKRSSRFRTNFRVQLLFRHRCRCRCHSPVLTFSLSLSLSLSSSCPSSSLSSVALKAKSKLLITSTVSGAAFYICHVQGF